MTGVVAHNFPVTRTSLLAPISHWHMSPIIHWDANTAWMQRHRVHIAAQACWCVCVHGADQRSCNSLFTHLILKDFSRWVLLHQPLPVVPCTIRLGISLSDYLCIKCQFTADEGGFPLKDQNEKAKSISIRAPRLGTLG